MRRKMHAGHPNPTPLFDLKHDPGGMVDIEFTSSTWCSRMRIGTER